MTRGRRFGQRGQPATGDTPGEFHSSGVFFLSLLNPGQHCIAFTLRQNLPTSCFQGSQFEASNRHAN